MTAFEALPPSWTALRSLRKLNFDYSGPPLEAEHALRPLGSWTQLTSLKFYDGFGVHLTPGNLEQQLTRLSALQHLHIGSLEDFNCHQGGGRASTPAWSAARGSCCRTTLVLPV